MLAQKKVSWTTWFVVSGIIMIGYSLLADLFGISSNWIDKPLVQNDYLFYIVSSVYLFVATGISVYTVMIIVEKKKINFYTSNRFKTERKILFLSLLILFGSWLIIVISGVFSGISFDAERDFPVLGLIPTGAFLIYYMIYYFVFILGLRKKYYDDSLDK